MVADGSLRPHLITRVEDGGREEARMLVLDRKVQEGFWIEDRIFVKVLAVGRRRVKLGIEAPTDMKIVREELRADSNGGGLDGHDAAPSEEQPEVEGSFRSARRRS